MKKLILLLSILSLHSDIIPSNRKIVWQGNVGVKGGITNRTTIFTNVTILNTNLPATAINNAIALCPVGQVVMLPTLDTRLETTINLKSGITLRGQGTNTTLRMNNDGGIMVKFFYDPWRTTTTTLLSGYTAGSTSIVVASTHDMDVGTMIQLTQFNNTNYIFTGIEGDGGSYAEGQQVRVIGISGTTLMIDPPLFADFSAGLSPIATWDVNGASGQAANNTCIYAGIEDILLVNEHPTGAFIVYANHAMYCWCKNVKTENAAIAHYNFYNSLGMQLLTCWAKNVIGPITSSRGYFVYLGTPNTGIPSEKSSSYLIEDCIDENTRGGPQIGYGSSGGVLGYNFYVRQTNEDATIMKADVVVHSSFPRNVLVEGCQGTKFSADNFHGNGGWITLFRNQWLGVSSNKYSNLGSIELDTKQRYYNVVGCVLGYPQLLSDINAMVSPAGTIIYSQEAPTPFNYDHHYAAFQLGYDGEGGGTSMTDTNVAYTLLRHGNVDYVGGTNAIIRWDPSITNHTLVNSYYLTVQPDWWPTNKVWPCIGPDINNYVVSIPARDRYYNTSTNIPPAILPAIPVIINGRIEIIGTFKIYPQ